jgi:hypothetical protein
MKRTGKEEDVKKDRREEDVKKDECCFSYAAVKMLAFVLCFKYRNLVHIVF